MEDKYHPKLIGTSLYDPKTMSKFRYVIGSLNCIITLTRIDVNFAAMPLSRFSMAPRVVHLKAVIRVLVYLKAFSKEILLLANTYPDHLSYKTDVE